MLVGCLHQHVGQAVLVAVGRLLARQHETGSARARAANTCLLGRRCSARRCPAVRSPSSPAPTGLEAPVQRPGQQSERVQKIAKPLLLDLAADRIGLPRDRPRRSRLTLSPQVHRRRQMREVEAVIDGSPCPPLCRTQALGTHVGADDGRHGALRRLPGRPATRPQPIHGPVFCSPTRPRVSGAQAAPCPPARCQHQRLAQRRSRLAEGSRAAGRREPRTRHRVGPAGSRRAACRAMRPRAAQFLADLRRDPTANRCGAGARRWCWRPSCRASIERLYAHFLHTPASVTRYAAIMRGLPWSVSAHAKDIWTSEPWEMRGKARRLRLAGDLHGAGRCSGCARWRRARNGCSSSITASTSRICRRRRLRGRGATAAIPPIRSSSCRSAARSRRRAMTICWTRWPCCRGRCTGASSISAAASWATR